MAANGVTSLQLAKPGAGSIPTALWIQQEYHSHFVLSGSSSVKRLRLQTFRRTSVNCGSCSISSNFALKFIITLPHSHSASPYMSCWLWLSESVNLDKGCLSRINKAGILLAKTCHLQTCVFRDSIVHSPAQRQRVEKRNWRKFQN